MKKFLISAAAAAIMTGTAYAQTEFYVVQDSFHEEMHHRGQEADHHHHCHSWRRQGVPRRALKLRPG